MSKKKAPVPPTQPVLLGKLQRALSAADQAIGVARRERERIAASTRMLTREWAEAETRVTEKAREGRQQLWAPEPGAVPGGPTKMARAAEPPSPQPSAVPEPESLAEEVLSPELAVV